MKNVANVCLSLLLVMSSSSFAQTQTTVVKVNNINTIVQDASAEKLTEQDIVQRLSELSKEEKVHALQMMKDQLAAAKAELDEAREVAGYYEMDAKLVNLEIFTAFSGTVALFFAGLAHFDRKLQIAQVLYGAAAVSAVTFLGAAIVDIGFVANKIRMSPSEISEVRLNYGRALHMLDLAIPVLANSNSGLN